MGLIIILLFLVGVYLVFKATRCDHQYVKMRVDEYGNHVKAIGVKVSLEDSLLGKNRPFEKCKKCGHIKHPIVREHPTEEELK